ncbi:MAG: glycosyltransferase [Planctomycetes bacterium]|nr:glycosyltransferase [Planctomycetota bacterium]
MSTAASLRILLVVHGIPPEFRGGTELYTVGLAKALQDGGHDVHILSGSAEGREMPEIERLECEGVPVHRLHRQGLFVDSWDKSYAPDVEALLRAVLADVQPDIVHVHHWVRLTRTIVATCHAAGLPVLATVHDTWVSCPRCFRIRDGSFCERELSVASCLDCVPTNPWQGRLELSTEIELFRDDFRQELALARCVIAPTEAHRDLVARTCGIDADRIRVVAHGAVADLERVDPDPDPAGRVRLGHWGHLYPMKGLHLLLEAAQLLPDDLRARLSIACWGEASDPEYRERLGELAEGLEVTWHGSFEQADLQGLSCDWGVFPSLASESYSFVLDEAFMLGLPVITSDRGAFRHRVGEAGIIFAAEDVGALSDVLLRIIEEPDLLAACRTAIPTPVRMADHAEELVDLYTRVLAEPAPEVELDLALRDRHLVHGGYRMEERSRQLMDALGRIEQERNRSEGLEIEFHKAEDVVEARDEHIDNLTRSVKDFQAELKRQSEELEAGREEYRRVTSALGSDGGEDAAVKRELETERQQKARAERELDAERRKRETAEGDLDARLLEISRGAERLAELMRAMDDYRAVVLKMEREVDVIRGRAEDARRRENELDERVCALERELATAERRRHEIASERDAVTELVQARQEEMDGIRGAMHEARDALGREKKHAAMLACDKAELGGRAVELQAALDRRDAVGRAVFSHLAGLARDLGVAPETLDGSALDQIATLLDTVQPVIMERHDLTAEMARSVEKVASEAQLIEEERTRLAAELAGEVEARTRRRRHFWYRLAERFAGGAPGLRSGERNGDGGSGLRVLVVIHDFLPGHAAGTEIYAYNLAKGLMARGAHVHLLYTEARPGVHSYFLTHGAYDGIPYTEVSHQHTTRHFDRTYTDPQMERLFQQVLDDVKPDVVHLQHLYHHSMGYIPIARSRGIPVVYTLHEYMLLCPRGGQMLREDLEICERPIPDKCADCIGHLSLEPAPEDEGRARLSSRLARHLPDGLKGGLKRLQLRESESVEAPSSRGAYVEAIQDRLDTIKAALAGVDLFISPSAFLRQKFIECGMVPAERIIASDNGQDQTPFKAVARTPSRQLRVGYIGTISEYKGVHVLIDAMNLAADLHDVRCDIWGSLHSFPEYAQSLPSRISNPRTRLRGRYDPKDVGHVLSELDAIIVPSLWYENSPLTIHEAFMAGIPVIASRLGGMAEFVNHGKNGLLFEVGSAVDLAARLRELDSDRGLLERLRNQDIEIKSIEDDVDDMLGRYEKLVDAARTGGSAGA